MASKTKTASYHDLIRIFFWFFYFVSDIKTKTANFCDLVRHLFLLLLLGLWLQNGNLLRHNKNCFLFFYYGFKNRCFLFLFMVLISIRKVSITWQIVCCYCFVYSYKIHNRVLITKMALTKLLENTLDICLIKDWDVWWNHS